MKWLVTGANGFLGRHVVDRFVREGDGVRAMVRPSADVKGLSFGNGVDWFRGDLRRCPNLKDAFDGVDGLVHVAAAVTGGPEEQFASTVVATENLLNAMVHTDTKRLILISSFSVYDWNRSRSHFDESTPLEGEELYERDGYAIAKSWQERIVRDAVRRHGWDLTVLRPGFIWGPGNEWCVGLGDVSGRRHVIIGPLRKLPLTHVVNCADCVVRCAHHPAAIGETFNVVDSGGPNAWRFAGDYLQRSGNPGHRVPVPYHAGLVVAHIAKGTSRMIFGRQGRLPGVLIPKRFVARFKSARFSNDKLADVIGWRSLLDYDEALCQTYSKIPPPHATDFEKPVASEAIHA
jgi:UDP-glucose 4-epimerase